jgi:predicted Kef-type K+ transport protein
VGYLMAGIAVGPFTPGSLTLNPPVFKLVAPRLASTA